MSVAHGAAFAGIFRMDRVALLGVLPLSYAEFIRLAAALRPLTIGFLADRCSPGLGHPPHFLLCAIAGGPVSVSHTDSRWNRNAGMANAGPINSPALAEDLRPLKW